MSLNTKKKKDKMMKKKGKKNKFNIFFNIVKFNNSSIVISVN